MLKIYLVVISCFFSSYEFDVTKCMFSFGNITEKLRIAGFDCRGETVVDLYAGVDTSYIVGFVITLASTLYCCYS